MKYWKKPGNFVIYTLSKLKLFVLFWNKHRFSLSCEKRMQTLAYLIAFSSDTRQTMKLRVKIER